MSITVWQLVTISNSSSELAAIQLVEGVLHPRRDSMQAAKAENWSEL